MLWNPAQSEGFLDELHTLLKNAQKGRMPLMKRTSVLYQMKQVYGRLKQTEYNRPQDNGGVHPKLPRSVWSSGIDSDRFSVFSVDCLESITVAIGHRSKKTMGFARVRQFERFISKENDKVTRKVNEECAELMMAVDEEELQVDG